jgi:hypothetical protein
MNRIAKAENADLIAAGSYGHRPRYHLLAMVKNLCVGSV